MLGRKPDQSLVSVAMATEMSLTHAHGAYLAGSSRRDTFGVSSCFLPTNTDEHIST